MGYFKQNSIIRLRISQCRRQIIYIIFLICQYLLADIKVTIKKNDLKPRPDKLSPSKSEIVDKTIFFAVSGSIFSGIGCYLLRKCHNAVNKYVIKQSNMDKAILLDIGTGQGGDLNTWSLACNILRRTKYFINIRVDQKISRKRK